MALGAAEQALKADFPPAGPRDGARRQGPQDLPTKPFPGRHERRAAPLRDWSANPAKAPHGHKSCPKSDNVRALVRVDEFIDQSLSDFEHAFRRRDPSLAKHLVGAGGEVRSDSVRADERTASVAPYYSVSQPNFSSSKA